MSRDSGGNYSLPAGVTATYRETPISSSKWNSALTDLGTEITDSLSRSGKGAMSAALDVGGYKVTNVALATTTGDALSYGRNATVVNFASTGTFAAKLASAKLWVGDSGGDAQAVTISGDIAISNTGVASIASGVIVDADVNASAAIAATKLALAGASLSGTFAALQFGSAEYNAGNSGTSITLNFANGQNQLFTLTGNCVVSFSNPYAGMVAKVRFVQGSGPYTITWPTIKWADDTAPVISSTSGQEDVAVLYYNGTDYYGALLTNFGVP